MPGSDPDRAARFAALLSPCLPRLLAGARFLMKDHHLAEDVLQGGLLEAFRSYDPAQHDDHFHARTWSFVTHAALEDRRRRLRREAFEGSLAGAAEDLVAELGAAEDHERILADPDRFLDEAGDVLKEGVLSLPDAERWVFLLRVMGDLKYREIAEALEVPLGSVMTWLHRARQHLRQALAARSIRRADP